MLCLVQAAPASSPSETEAVEPHVVGALLEVKASLRKPSFGGGVRSPCREDNANR